MPPERALNDPSVDRPTATNVTPRYIGELPGQFSCRTEFLRATAEMNGRTVKHATAICVTLFCLQFSATAGSLFVSFRNAPAAPCIITLLVDDGSTKKPVIVTRHVLPSEPPIIQQMDLVQEATYRIRAAILWPDQQTLRLSAVAAVQNVRVTSASTSNIDLLFMPVAMSVQHSSSGGNEMYSASLDDLAGFFADQTATGVLSIRSGRLGQVGVKRYFSHLSRSPAGSGWNASFSVPGGLDESSYQLMLFVPELSDSGRMAIIESPSSVGTSFPNAPVPVDEFGRSSEAAGLRTTMIKDASDEAGKSVVRVGAGGRLVRVVQK